jgi:hypothetical protein
MLACGAVVFGQHVEVRPADPVTMPGEVDCNSPAFWLDGEMFLFNSTGNGPLLSRGTDQFHLGNSMMSRIQRLRPWPTWIESVWVDPSGAILAWYHQEQENICGAQRPAQAYLGAAVSYDGGHTFWDLGHILSSGDPADCSSQNLYISGGHGDLSVILDQDRKYFYFLFTNYGGPLETQGVAIARLDYDLRFSPAGNVWKYFEGAWEQPGLTGRLTPLFPAKVRWQEVNADSFWGPSIHWNSYLQAYVVLLNRSCCDPGFPQKGIYWTFNSDLSNPAGWKAPHLISRFGAWYPQVLGTRSGDTGTLAGRVARLYIGGLSQWTIIFHRE